MESYFRAIESEVDRAYSVAETARKVGYDPEVVPEIPRAQDMAMRVEKLLAHLGIEGISTEIRALASSLPREEVALTIARRIARDPARGDSVAKRVEAALRVGLAILTEGILVAPLEGLAEVHLREDERTRSSYIELYYAGPIRAAGGTAQALSVLLADVVRRDLGIAPFRPLPEEVGRYQEEIPLYKIYQHLQYVPTPDEIGLVVRHVPVAISGEATEGDAEVSAFRNLDRVETNGIRGGACLVIAEGLCQKAPKLRKIVEKLGLDGWEFLAEVGHSTGDEEEARTPKYLRDSVGGRPVLAHPAHPGAFRLVYGRARTTGLAACAVNPATMVLLQNFVAIGTQVKLEYPGKAAAMGVCDTIEGPIVELDDGTVTAVHDLARALELRPRVRRVVDLGEILVSFGEFLENNQVLVPSGYSLDWHLEELRAAGAPEGEGLGVATYDDAVRVSQTYRVPLHPRWLLFWHDLTPAEVRALAEFVERSGRWVGDGLLVPADPLWREVLVRLGFLFAPVGGEDLRGEPDASAALVGGLGLAPEGERLVRRVPLDPVEEDALTYVSRLAGVPVRARGPSRVGGRVGRPEKAHQRSMQPNVHGLFPVGAAGGPTRSLPEAARRTMREGVKVDLGVRTCSACGRSTVWTRCPCGAHTEPTGATVTEPLPVARLWSDALERLRLSTPPVVKGVKGLTSPGKVPESIEKGILRASHAISVYQDGTARFDLTDLPLTHFRPAEVGTDVATLRTLGYTRDWSGQPLVEGDQLVELLPQDLIVSRSCGAYLTRLAQFVDDELVRLYEVEPFYRADRPEQLVGQIVVALAPHTSGGVAGRILGFTDAEACFAHPVFHAAKRRNCDGDEDSVTLLLNALLNFSRSYLPESRGALMDKPLVLTTRLETTEVDKEAHNVDVSSRYPLALYQAAADRKPSKEVEPLLDLVGHRLGSPRSLSGYGFTHDTRSIAGGPVRSAYRERRPMAELVERSIVLASQIRAVDLAEAITLVLNAHFLPDVMGNLKSYGTQTFRCKTCDTSYRRPPLTGRCVGPGPKGRCDGELLSTVYEASVRKYLPLSQRLGAMEGITPYVRQRIQLLADSVATLFPGATAQTTLDRFRPGTVAAPERADGVSLSGPGAPPDAADPESGTSK
ncbi:MAG TPA: DNA polymerase II large subunit [Thermoplasmata archaeon]|nr:DNA polymerase II large subunit [Thermoplasmata archaeon]